MPAHQRARGLSAALLAALLTLHPLSSKAAESVWTSLQLHGFAAQAAIGTSDNRWFARYDGVSFDFTEVGLNASLRPRPWLLLAGQVLARRAGEMYDGTPAIDFALADVSLLSSPRQRAGLRLGRIKNPLGIYNETRDVPFTHPGIFLPQVVYFDKVRNLVLSTDGAMFYGETDAGLGTLSLNLQGGRAVIDTNVEWAYLGADFPGNLEPDGNSWLAGIWFNSRLERLRLGVSGVSTALRFDPSRHAGFTLGPGTTDILYLILSAQYSAETWTLTSEYAREPLRWKGFGPYFPELRITGEGYYVQGTWRPHPAIELLLDYQEGFADRTDRNGRAYAVASKGLSTASPRFSRIFSAGIRWDINQHWMVRAEYQHHQGAFILSSRENPDPGQLVEHWDLFAVQAVFRF
ncbi:hypothetical protein [uncultured Thiodictyon sp.]|uniref:hypothetical protein n=1 Tax=uncultured Thiodictyon sp. TaxID=1846217 RepID=UPI0025F56980|nr:hypothetical protein [uncultured Thiodictyon sp.]